MSETATSSQRRGPAPQVGPSAGALGSAPERSAPQLPANSVRRTAYVLSWGVLALAAGGYLTAVIFKPQFLKDWLPSVGPTLTQPQGNDLNRSAAIAEAQKLRATLRTSQSEVARLQLELGNREAQVKVAELRIANLEKEIQSGRASETLTQQGRPNETASIRQLSASETTPSSPVAAEATSSADVSRRALANAIGSPQVDTAPTARAEGSPRGFELVNGAIVATQGFSETVAAAMPEADIPLPSRKPAGIVARKTTPIVQLKRQTVAVKPVTPQAIETGSVEAFGAAKTKATIGQPSEPIRFGTPVVTRSAAPIGIRLTAGPSVDALRLSWSLMSERYGSELGSLQPRYVMGNTPAAPYALVAGPFASDQEAQRVCGSLIAKGIPCSVDIYGGNAL